MKNAMPIVEFVWPVGAAAPWPVEVIVPVKPPPPAEPACRLHWGSWEWEGGKWVRFCERCLSE